MKGMVSEGKKSGLKVRVNPHLGVRFYGNMHRKVYNQQKVVLQLTKDRWCVSLSSGVPLDNAS